MLETIIEKMKEYKILIGLSLIGLIIAGFFMINGQSSRQSNVAELAQETVTSSEAESEEILDMIQDMLKRRGFLIEAE